MRGLKRLRSARVISTAHAFAQNLHRGHYELGLDIDPKHRLPTAFTELAAPSDRPQHSRKSRLLPIYATEPDDPMQSVSPGQQPGQRCEHRGTHKVSEKTRAASLALLRLAWWDRALLTGCRG